MRMRRKKNLPEKLNAVSDYVIMSVSGKYFKLAEKDRYAFLDYNELFNNSNPVEMEIGTGKGKFLTEMAIKNPDINYIGVEVAKQTISTMPAEFNEFIISSKVEPVVQISSNIKIVLPL